MAKSKYRIAVGLHYDADEEGVPVVGVKAELARADEVVKLARRYSIPIIEDSKLARAVNELPLDQQIPKELFHAVAAILNGIEKTR